MSYIRNWGSRLKNIFKLRKFFKLKDTVCLLGTWVNNAIFCPNSGLETFDTKKIYYIEKWLVERYGYLIPERFEESDICNNNSTEKEPIWVFWYQGENNMPDIVKLCYKSICNNSNSHPVNLLTKDNLANFVELPDFILEKVEKGFISYTHLSDIIRMNLLYLYGGLWMDCTLFINSPIETENFNSLFHSIKIEPEVKGTISDFRWATFYLYAQKKSMAFGVFKNLIFSYWKENDRSIEYFLIDYFFDLLYRKNQEFRRVIDTMPYSNPNLYLLFQKINKPYDDFFSQRNDLNTTIFKLNHRPKYIMKDRSQSMTLYGYLVKTYLTK
jgi:hypothetical protein